jgi:hypothetical protein
VQTTAPVQDREMRNEKFVDLDRKEQMEEIQALLSTFVKCYARKWSFLLWPEHVFSIQGTSV